jgi:hypothetical protein
MMTAGIPKISSVQPERDGMLRVLFDNGFQKLYDCKPLIEKFGFQLLLNEAFFKTVRVDPGGFGISWNADIDLSEYELWTNGIPCENHQESAAQPSSLSI